MQDDHVPEGTRSASGGADLKTLLEAYERNLIVEALAASGGHQRRTAARLGVLPTTLHEKMKRLGLLRRASAVRKSEAGNLDPARDGRRRVGLYIDQPLDPETVTAGGRLFVMRSDPQRLPRSYESAVANVSS